MTTVRIKYPCTPHLPWSPGARPDDDLLSEVRHFEGVEVVVTEKMDGENANLYLDALHARSLDTRPHPSRDWLKGLWGRLRWQIPQDWRLCGENLYARHSITYPALEGYFYLFSVWDEHNCAQSWDDTLEWAARLELPTPPTLYRGPWDEARIRALDVDPQHSEGYVVRRAGSFGYAEFGHSLGKWVRPQHVQTDEHWMHRQVVPNGLRQARP